jgi:hypothetical protein
MRNGARFQTSVSTLDDASAYARLCSKNEAIMMKAAKKFR